MTESICCICICNMMVNEVGVDQGLSQDLENGCQKLGVLRGGFRGFRCPKRHTNALLAKTMALIPDPLISNYLMGETTDLIMQSISIDDTSQSDGIPRNHSCFTSYPEKIYSLEGLNDFMNALC